MKHGYAFWFANNIGIAVCGLPIHYSVRCFAGFEKDIVLNEGALLWLAIWGRPEVADDRQQRMTRRNISGTSHQGMATAKGVVCDYDSNLVKGEAGRTAYSGVQGEMNGGRAEAKPNVCMLVVDRRPAGSDRRRGPLGLCIDVIYAPEMA
ncbi:hypothetical protein EV126DRAFT_409691 [Verticillium dahliae]|nr:hypothetical protein EV126DRAFT_409691 [Verticillium dahliae]